MKINSDGSIEVSVDEFLRLGIKTPIPTTIVGSPKATTTKKPKPTGNGREIYNLLFKSKEQYPEGWSVQEISCTVGLSVSATRNWVNTLQGMGLIEKCDGFRGKWVAIA